jgi:CHAT domain-containing protein
VVDDQSAQLLEANQPIKRKIACGEFHYYRITILADQYVRLTVDQRGVDVSVKLYQPDGKIVAESNRLIGAYGPEIITWVAAVSGLYKLEVRSTRTDQTATVYEVKILEERTATVQDRNRIPAQNVFMQAEQFRFQTNPNSIDQALAKYEEALPLWRDAGSLSGEAETLNVMGLVYHLLKRDPVNARQRYEKALEIQRRAGDRRGEAETLNNLARVYESQGERQTALDYYNRSLQPWRDAGDQYGEAWTFYNIGRVHYFLKDAAKALENYERSLKLWRDLGDLSRQASTLNSIGDAYVLSTDYKSALIRYEEARGQSQAAGDLNGEASSLFALSKAYGVLQSKNKESEFLKLAEQLKLKAQQSCAQPPDVQAKSDKARAAEQAQEEARTLLLQNNEASQRKAIDKNEEAVRLFDSAGDYDREVFALFDISSIYRTLGDKDNERKTLDRSLSVAQRSAKLSLRAEALQRLGMFHSFAGDQLKAVDYYDRALEIWRRQNDRRSEAYVLGVAAKAYDQLNEKEKAIAYLERALKLYQDLGDRFREAYTLNDLAAVHHHPEEKQKALEYLKRTRDLRREKGDRAGEAETLKEIVSVYLSMGQKKETLDYYHQALALYRQVKDGLGEAAILRDLMDYWKELKQPRLAILYGKQAINTYQGIRQNIQTLEKNTQASFLRSKEDVYRELADLLISEGRLPEAQQVLDMLKEEEFNNFIRGDSKKEGSATDRTELTPRESELDGKYKELIDRATSLGSEYDQLLAKPARNADENQRLKDLTGQIETANEAFQKYLTGLSKALGDSDESRDRVKTIEGFEGLQSTLKELGPGAVALYTLVVKDKYRVILFTPNVRVPREYSIEAAELNRKIMALRLALQDPKSDPLPPAKALYQILIGPIAKDLAGANAKTLMWSLDGALRYVPIAALHDGEKYMVERFRNEIFTLASHSRLGIPPIPSWRGLGLGVSTFSGDFNPLPGVVDELNGIIKNEEDPKATGGALPGKIMLDDKFTREALIPALQLQQYKLVHIASHFKLQPGDGMASFLVLGKGDKLTVAQIKNLPGIFTGVDLLTLSACNTAVGVGGANGEEVDGFGELAQRRGAKAVIASLWSVADASTGLLMQKFYQFRMRDSQPASKAEALQEAQLSFLHKEVKAPDASQKDYSHPYFWAPFILIGNWQ